MNQKKSRMFRQYVHPLCMGMILLLTLASVAQTQPWKIDSATVRVNVTISEKPAHPELGVFVKTPPGDPLPGRYPISEVLDVAGNPLPHLQIGYHPQDGLGILFAQPENGDQATIYLRGSATPLPPPAGVNLIPSVFYFTRNGNASLNAAKRLATGYPPARNAFFDTWRCIGSMVNPFGPDDDYVSWFVGCIHLEKPERIYFATVSDEGSEFAINGKTIYSWPGLHKRDAGAKGQKGTYVELEAGLHRIDYFHFEATGDQEAQLVWRRKGVTTSDMPELVTGFVRSGTASIQSIQFSDGRVGAVIQNNNVPEGYFWLGDKPLTLFSVSASGVPQSDTPPPLIWELEKGKQCAGNTLDWLVPGDQDLVTYPIALIVSNAAGVARSTARLVSRWTPEAFSFDNSSDRLAFRKAFYDMVRASHKSQDPCEDWSRDHWEMLIDLLEPYRGGPILTELFTRSGKSIKKLPPSQRWFLEDRFVESLRLKQDEAGLLQWIDQFERDELSSDRRFHWSNVKIGLMLVYQHDIEKIRQTALQLKETSLAPEHTQIATLRLGDVEYAAGNGEAALEHYRDAQERFRQRHSTGIAGGRTGVGINRRSGAVRRGRGASPLQRIEDWKIYTVHDASNYATLIAFIEQKAIPEAFERLYAWENGSSVSKLGGEYALAEAKLYMFVGDTQRALYRLALYRKNVTMSAQLADVMRLEIECYQKLEQDDKAKELIAEFMQRFPGHPYEKPIKESVIE